MDPKPRTRRHTRPPGDAYEDAIRFLGARARSVAEIRRRLRGKQHDELAIDGAIERLRANGHVDDLAFAKYWLEQRERFRPKGDRALVSELLQKGVAREAIDTVLGERAPDAQLAQARAAIRKPLARWSGMDDADRKRRVQAYLVQRGFDYATIEEVLEHPAAEEDEAEP